ncbi:NAD(P)-dependent oxidoreductase [Glaciihabitans arcticus]|uniref:NAD(P)-dependent oxidoreductase n=1 Tax=Glaciihabitans arcticus TaxID=2668039 RepID=A0A4Q9GSA5_9MICO|nr:NAD(P)-dependent oxidoreductase [Glaciihabitans arcticus]TBN57465.1 NAD(P)-dependent oxidoreductase [Glaciihabitans arcticus]
MRIAVTGASGFVGGAAATALAADGHNVVGFGRTPNGWAGDYHVWDLADGPASHGTFDAVVHSAALADDWATYSTARAANVDGTRAVLECFPETRFVHLSTSSVYDALTPTIDAREDSAEGARYLSAYSRTKAEAEQLFAGLNAVILRPHAVYGPGDTTLLPRILAGVRRGRLVLPSGGRVLHTLTHIDNLVAAIRLAVSSDERGTFNVGDACPVQLSDVLSELLAKQGRQDVALTSIPYSTAFAVAGGLERLHRITGGRPRLTRYAVSQLGLERTLGLDAARERLGFDPFATTLDGAELW